MEGLYPHPSDSPWKIPIGLALPYPWDQTSLQSPSLRIIPSLAITQHYQATLSRPTPAHQCPSAAHLCVTQ